MFKLVALTESLGNLFHSPTIHLGCDQNNIYNLTFLFFYFTLFCNQLRREKCHDFISIFQNCRNFGRWSVAMAGCGLTVEAGAASWEAVMGRPPRRPSPCIPPLPYSTPTRAQTPAKTATLFSNTPCYKNPPDMFHFLLCHPTFCKNIVRDCRFHFVNREAV